MSPFGFLGFLNFNSFCTISYIYSVQIASQLLQVYNHTIFVYEYMNSLKIIPRGRKITWKIIFNEIYEQTGARSAFLEVQLLKILLLAPTMVAPSWVPRMYRPAPKKLWISHWQDVNWAYIREIPLTPSKRFKYVQFTLRALGVLIMNWTYLEPTPSTLLFRNYHYLPNLYPSLINSFS